MKHLLFSLTAAFSILCFSSSAAAEKIGFYQQTPKDSIPKKTLGKVRVTVKDLIDGTALDSVYVTVASKRGYTNNNGIIEFDSVVVGYFVTVSKAGYLAQSKKAKADLQLRLSKREIPGVTGNYKNGFYERPVEHFSGAATIVKGDDLRKVNPLNFAEALKYYDPSFIVSRDNVFY